MWSLISTSAQLTDLRDMHEAHVLCSSILPLKYLHVMWAGLLEKGAAFFSDLCRYAWMDFPLLLLVSHACMLLPDIWEGFSIRVNFSGLVHCWDSSPFLQSCWCWLWSVTASTNHLAAIWRDWGEVRSLATALIFRMCYFHTRADNLFVASDFNT